MTRPATPLLLLSLFLTLARPAWPADPPATALRGHHVRTTDGRLRRLMRIGIRLSPTFRDLVERLEQSDVIVYIECGGAWESLGGRLSFVSAVAGFRYVHVRVARLSSRDQQIAMIGHELRHAVEVADAPDVVDADSLVREYTRIGFSNPRVVDRVAFDSGAAVEAGYQVLREMVSRPDVVRLARGD